MPLTIFKRLVIGNIIILGLVLLLGGATSFNLIRLQRLNSEVVVKNQESIFVGEQLLDSFFELVKLDEKYFVARDKDYLKRFNEKKRGLELEFITLSTLMETKNQQALFAKTYQAYNQYLSWFDNRRAKKKPTDFDLLLRQRSPLVQAVSDNLKSILFTTRIIVRKKSKLSGQMTDQILMVTIATTLLTLLVGIGITVLNTRSIRNSVSRLQKQTKEISLGRFKQIRKYRGPKEIQDLAQHFNTMCQRLGELDVLKADFINHVSHELRTPLTSIKEASNMLLKGFYDSSPDKQSQLFSLIHDECRRLLRSVMRILDYSKMEAGKMEYQIQPVFMPDLIRKSILKLVPLAQKKNIRLEFTPPESHLPTVQADEDKIIEVLDNLVGNALKFTEPNGKVNLTCTRAKNKKDLKVVVEDNGAGIKLEHLEKIFYKFEQIDKDLNTRMGTGLGLSISKYIIKAHGGKIWAQSIESKGTKISFTLPAVS